MRSSWVQAVNKHGELGRWAFLEVTDIYEASKQIRAHLDAARPPVATILLAMATKPPTLAPGALAERERVLRILRPAARPGRRATSIG